MSVRPRLPFARLVLAFLLAVSTVAVTWNGASPAHADEGDKINKFDANYVLDTSGKLTVTETINYHFGDPDRHGIYRDFYTRVFHDRFHDQKYSYHIVSVSSPTGAPADYDTSTETNYDGSKELRVQIGDPDRYVSKQNETYKIVYTVKGALRSFSGYDELYWDTLGTEWDGATFKKVRITASVPGGVQDLRCYTGDIGATDSCSSAQVSGGRAVITQKGVDAYDEVTMGVKIKSGLVSDNEPHIVLRTGVLIFLIGGIATVITLLGSVIGGILYYRSRGRDQRYLDLAPGTLPAQGQNARVGSTSKIEIPVRFTPPPIPVGEAGLLVDGQFQHRDTAATLVDLAVRGAVRLDGEKDDVEVVLLDRGKAAAPHEKALLQGIFSGKGAGARKKLGRRGSLTKADDAAAKAAARAVGKRNWFVKVPERVSESSRLQNLKWGAFGIVFVISLVGGGAAKAMASGTAGQVVLAVIIPLVPIVVTFFLLLSRIGRRGVRTPDGRAICDQVDGFRTYLATAEAEQLQFEEGKDIFSAYLPWAIAFNLTDRWTKICARLVELGRIPDVSPNWYSGAFRISSFDAGLITGSVLSSVQPIPSSSSGGSSFSSGGSSFSGGGGSSGGGGGGGGGGSW